MWGYDQAARGGGAGRVALDSGYGRSASEPSIVRGKVVSASSSLAGEIVRERSVVSRLSEQMEGLGLPSYPESFVRGLCNPQGLIELKSSYAESSIKQLQKDLGGMPIQLGRDVLVYSVESIPEAGGLGQGYSQYVALVNAGGRELLVPLTEIDEGSLGDPSDASTWQHPAFFSHLKWLAQEHHGLGPIERHPTCIVPRLRSQGQVTASVAYAAFLDAAFSQCRFSMLMSLSNERSANRTIRSDFAEDSRQEQVAPRAGQELCLPRKGGSLFSKVSGAFKRGVQSPFPAEGRSPRLRAISEGPSQPVVVLPSQATLRGRKPENEGVAPGVGFIDKQQAPNLCGVAAINGFFQASVLGGKHAVKEIVGSYLGLLDSKGKEKLLNALPGLFHPKVVRAMRRGESVTISREAFFDVPDSALNDVMYPMLNEEAREAGFEILPDEIKNQARVAEQWRAYFNFKYPGQTNREALIQDSRSITISPDEWISTFAGLGFEHVIKLTNDLLRTKGREIAWRDYPNQVDGVGLSFDESKKWSQLENLSLAVEHLGVKHLICMSGGGMTGHYFALVKDAAGCWLKMDGANASIGTGLQPVKPDNVAKRGELSSKLLAWGVTHFIADQRLVNHFQHPLGE
jgi:hypothetical protein